MYLEISPRITGKTTRLIQTVINSIDAGNEYHVIVAINSLTRDDIKRQINEVCNYLHSKRKLAVISSHQNLHTVCMAFGLNPSNWSDVLTLYYDEFDFMPQNDVIINSNWYYVTTAKHARTIEDYKAVLENKSNDPLLNLLKMNNGVSVQHDPFLTDTNYERIHTISSVKPMLQEEQFNIEVLNQYKPL